jgi:NADPH:quinone reductase-like Zn-dependent oxidoreductase
MTVRLGLFTEARGPGFALQWRAVGDSPRLGAHEVHVRVRASSVNPIDVKRAAGYGARLLKIKGAAGMPRVLGNDFAGVVVASGSMTHGFEVGQRVCGVLDTGPVGAHASQLMVPANQVFSAPEEVSDMALAALPYSFCTVWCALHDARVDARSAKGRRILLHGASGGLGMLALQLLRNWGAITTAVCSTPAIDQCLAAGASDAFDRSTNSLRDLPSTYDAVFNFATWSDERVLASKLNKRALGMATTTHPLLASLDQHGWWGGLWRIAQEKRAVRHIVRQRNPDAAYRWTVFRPDALALSTLDGLLREAAMALPIGVSCAVTDAQPAFAHVAQQKRGRAILTFPTE